MAVSESTKDIRESVCLVCSAVFQFPFGKRRGRPRLYCGQLCAESANRQRAHESYGLPPPKCGRCGGRKKRGHALCRRCRTIRPETKCEQCGSAIVCSGGRGKRKRFCSDCARVRRLERYRAAASTVAAKCIQCDGEFFRPRRKPRKCCSEKCLSAWLSKIHQPARMHRCAFCENEFQRRSGDQKYCSRSCGFRGRSERKRLRLQSEKDARSNAKTMCLVCKGLFDRTGSRTCSSSCREELARARYVAARPIHRRICRHCGSTFSPTFGQIRLCSDTCRDAERRRHHRIQRKKRGRGGRKHTDRARDRGLKRDYSISPLKVYDRDGWICRLCCKRIPKRLFRKNEDMAPSVDHIVPLSHPDSPGHIWSNVQTAHRLCNSKKNRQILGQLRLL